MGYQFGGNGNYIDWGTASQLQVQGEMSVTAWIKMPKYGGAGGFFLNGQLVRITNGLPLLSLTMSQSGIGGQVGNGVVCYHAIGGSGGEGVDCVPGEIDPAWKWLNDQWMFVGFSRSLTHYKSYFGSRSTILDGPIVHFTVGPIDVGPGRNSVGALCAGSCATIPGYDAIVGPVTLWSRVLLKSEFALVAKCQLPDETGLVFRTKMQAGAADISPFMWTAHFHGSPIYVPDTACSEYGAGQDYRLTSP